MQTYFNVLYMPTFAINLITILIMKPFLKPFGEYWNNGEYKNFIKIILQISLMLFVATLIIEGVCYFIGIPILNLVFGLNLNIYKNILLILLFSGFFYAISTVLFYAFGTIRKQNVTTIVYLITAVLGKIISDYCVSQYQIKGAAFASLLIMFILSLIMTIFFVFEYKRKKISISNNI